MQQSEFLSLVNARTVLPDESEIDPSDVVRRMTTNPICIKCHQDYKTKFSEQPFQIVCEGIYDDTDFNRLVSVTPGSTYESVREVLDKAYWAKKYIKVVNVMGDRTKFVPRPYQEENLRCTSYFKVDRWGRGMGKSVCGQIDDLHTVINADNYPILIACPGKALAEKWFIDIKAHIENDEELVKCLKSSKQAPFYQFNFTNGSTISIFTTGSESGKGARSIRGQNPFKVRLDEQDLLGSEDYTALRPLWRRFKHSKFSGSSTPTGKREDFFEMCRNFPTYKEFFFPINLHPDYNADFDSVCRLEAKTEANYQHEFLAEFADQVGGVFRNEYVDLSKKHYAYEDLKYNANWRYFMGIDWNGQGTGTRYRVVGFDPVSKKRTVVAHAAIDGSTKASYEKLRDLNQIWHCEEVIIDRGHGHVQEEQIQLIGLTSMDADDKRLAKAKFVDFGAKLVTNKITPNRNYAESAQEREKERPAKPFIVEGAVMCLEEGLFEFSDKDKLLEDQLRAYRVKSYSPHGWANVYASGNVGDHDLDALMLALLGIELKYGLFAGKGLKTHIPAFASLTGFGQNSLDMSGQGSEISRQSVRTAVGIPSRAIPNLKSQDNQHIYFQRNNMLVQSPQNPRENLAGRGGVTSRTSVFQTAKGAPPRRFGYR